MDELDNLYAMERDMESLQPLAAGVEEDVETYLAGLRAAIQQTEDYRELDMLRKEERQALQVIEGLVDRRVAKLIGYASLRAVTPSLQVPEMNARDREVLEQLTNALKGARGKSSLANVLTPNGHK